MFLAHTLLVFSATIIIFCLKPQTHRIVGKQFRECAVVYIKFQTVCLLLNPSNMTQQHDSATCFASSRLIRIKYDNFFLFASEYTFFIKNSKFQVETGCS